MTPSAILAAVRAAGVTLRVDSGRILASPPRTLPPDLAAAIRANRAEVLTILSGPSTFPGRVLTFSVHRRRPAAPLPTHPAGTPYRLRLARDYSTDAVKDGEACPTCQGTDWRLTPPGLWMDDAGHYWSPPRQALETDTGTVPPVGIDAGATP